ncbi:methyltransferase family protein [Thermodesulfitimonas autotrophica]|uniref:Methyltransferase family protein n=1 Tax=Thermodesulfitimonas autotrophica TaxID=1894989 RepID=A0A3N5BB27_9THEO|nr:class I SAM-dependent methyltransferase [Thermodesulfitimonas autotrophica]RPF42905.1 methyltransferase family protein [Thermodesulfitimonas autotrophica]
MKKLPEVCKALELKLPVTSRELFAEFNLLSGHPWEETAGSEVTTYYPCLYGIAQTERPRRILEIGTAFGMSAATLLKASPEIELFVSLDLGIYADQLGFSTNNIDFAREKIHDWCRRKGIPVERVRFFRANTQPLGKGDNENMGADIPRWHQIPELVNLLKEHEFDLIFVDGKHTEDGLFNDLTTFWPFLKPGGLIVCDDLHDEATYQGIFPWAGDTLRSFERFLRDHEPEIEEFFIWDFPQVPPEGLLGRRPFGLIRKKRLLTQSPETPNSEGLAPPDRTKPDSTQEKRLASSGPDPTNKPVFATGADLKRQPAFPGDQVTRNDSRAVQENREGERLFLQGDVEGALKAFTRAIAIAPNLAPAYNNLGVCYWQKGEFENAVNHFLKALELDPDNADALANYIKILISLNEVEGAKKLYSNYLKRNPAGDEEIASVLANFTPPPCVTIEHKEMGAVGIPVVSVKNLHEKLGFERPISYPVSSFIKPLAEWKMESDDAPTFRYIYRNFRPRRHLEFGTWQGTGTVYCLEECDATVWTINLPFGEDKPSGEAAYGCEEAELPAIRAWARKLGLPEQGSYRTDTIGFIGRVYLQKELGHRVCQIYCDSRKWEISNYPPGFFDSALIDGGHTKDVVINDTLKAFQLARSGGIIMWHDFCPPIWKEFATTLGVTEGVLAIWKEIQKQVEQLFWIYPSFILLAVKK